MVATYPHAGTLSVRCIDELNTFELRLRRSAAARVAATAADRADGPASPELGELFAEVAQRRARRATTSVPRTGRPPGADDPSIVSAGPPGQVLAVQQLTAMLRILRIGRPDGLDFDAGQYLKVGVAGRRSGSFSLASAPHDPYLELCVELIPSGRLTPALFTLSPGDRVELSAGAKGSLRLDPSVRTHLLVGTVTGIAPLRSLVRDALHRGVPGRLMVLHGASHSDELPYSEELTALADAEERVSYLPTVSRPSDPRNQSWRGRTGRVDALASAVATELDPSATRVYATGNSGMIESVRSSLGAAGFAISTEAFH